MKTVKHTLIVVVTLVSLCAAVLVLCSIPDFWRGLRDSDVFLSTHDKFIVECLRAGAGESHLGPSTPKHAECEAMWSRSDRVRR
jgi:hypothetical protein